MTRGFTILRRVAGATLLWWLSGHAAADYTSPTLGTRLDSPRDLATENVRILAEHALPDGSTLLEVAADLRNLESALWSGVTVGATKAVLDGLAEVLSSTIEFGDLAAGAAAAAPAMMHVVVNEADAAAARAEILGGAVLSAVARTASGAAVTGKNEVAIEVIEITHEVVLADGRRLIMFACSVRNTTAEALQDVVVNFSSAAATVAYGFALGAMSIPSVAANALVTGAGAFYLASDAAGLADLRARLLSGELVDVAGTELYVFSAPPRGIDQATESAWLSTSPANAQGEWTMKFQGSTAFLASLVPGEILLEDPGINRLKPRPWDNPADPFDSPEPVLADRLPLEVVGVQVDGEGNTLVTGRQKELLEIVKSATFFQDSGTSPYDNPVRDPYDPPLENTYTAAEQAQREAAARIIEEQDPRDGRLADLRGLTAKPWHFNEVQISPKVKLTGEILIRSSGLKLEVKIRDFQLQRAIAHIDAGVAMNLVLECEGKEDTSGVDEADKSERLFDLPFPGVTMNIAGVPVQIAPLFFLDAGVEAEIPQSLTLPLQSSFIVGMDLGWERSRVGPGNDGFFYEPVTEFIPLRVSDPTLFDELAASVGAWAELGVGIVGSVAPLGLGQRGILNLGPSLTVKAAADFTVAPLADPWWALDFDIGLSGNFAMDILGQSLVDASIPILSYELPEFDRDAGGPLPALAPENIDPPSNAGIKPLAGKNVRWGRLFQPRNSFGGFNRGFVTFPGPGDEIAIGGESRIGYSTIARFTPSGELVWARDMGTQRLVKTGAGLSDGNVLTVGNKGNELVLSQFDAAGNRTWVTTLAPSLTSYEISDVAVARDPNGQPAAIFLCGHVNHGVVTQSDPLLLKFDPSGNLVWSKYYALGGDDEAHGMAVLEDGGLLLAGRTDADVASPPLGTPDPYNVIKNMTDNGLLMKVSAADGSVTWANSYVGQTLVFGDVVESPSGELYCGGSTTRTVVQSRPVTCFAKFAADGTMIDHVTVGDDPDLPDELSNGGNTPYDSVARLVWAEDGLIACGNTGLGMGQAGWVMGLTDELGVKFYSVVDGVHTDTFFDVAAGPDGIAVVGNTQSMYPWGSAGTPMPLLLKLPWEGLMRFHPDTAVRSLVLRPQVYHSSADLDYAVISSIENPGSPPQVFTNRQSPAGFVATDLAWTPGSTPAVPAAAPALTLLAVEKVEAGQVKSFDDWVAYHNLQGDDALPTADSDGDGLKNAFEAFFGRSPYVAETDPPVTLSAGTVNGQAVVILEFNRAGVASSLGVSFESSENLEDWLAASGLTEQVQALDANLERVTVIAARDVPAKFFRLVSTLAGAAAPR